MADFKSMVTFDAESSRLMKIARDAGYAKGFDDALDGVEEMDKAAAGRAGGPAAHFTILATARKWLIIGAALGAGGTLAGFVLGALILRPLAR